MIDVAGLRRWTDQDLRAFAVFWVGGLLVSIVGATMLLSAIDDGAEACTTGNIDAVEPTAEWDQARGRTPGQLAEEAAERARGDRNRMLFVG
mgnify:CR=1 FL=1